MSAPDYSGIVTWQPTTRRRELPWRQDFAFQVRLALYVIALVLIVIWAVS